jgi:Hfq protein
MRQSCGESFCVLLDCDGHQIVYKHAITTTSPAHAVALQDKSGPVEDIPAAKRPLIVERRSRPRVAR